MQTDFTLAWLVASAMRGFFLGVRCMTQITITGTVIAKGAPNRCQDGRTVMCAIVVSDELDSTHHMRDDANDWLRAVAKCREAITDGVAR